MNFKEILKCQLAENEWIDQEHRNCDTRYGEPELNTFCHELVERELERRKTFCK
jgi:hypothetical protein